MTFLGYVALFVSFSLIVAIHNNPLIRQVPQLRQIAGVILGLWLISMVILLYVAKRLPSVY